MSEERITRVAVVATGVIGASWVAYFLAQGLKVVATDPGPGAEDKLRQTVEQHWPTMQRLGLAPGASPDNLAFDAVLENAVEGAQFVQENGPEREDIKIDLFSRMDAVLPEQVVLASSSSGLPQRSSARWSSTRRSASGPFTHAGRSRVISPTGCRRRSQMEFAPIVRDVKSMDPALFQPLWGRLKELVAQGRS